MQPKEPLSGAEEAVDDVHDDPPAADVDGSREYTAASKPLLMVDIDGVISLFAHPTDGWPGVGEAGVLQSIEGIPHFLSATAASHLLGLQEHFELVWASGWEEKAEEHLPRLLGLPPRLPYLRFDRSVGRSNAHWKLDAIEDFAAGRPLAWLDDALNEACRSWAQARSAPTLLVQTDPRLGLTGHERELLTRWALQLRAVA